MSRAASKLPAKAPEVVACQAILTRHGGDGESLWLKFEVSQAQLDQIKPLLGWGKRLLTLYVKLEPQA